MQKILSTSLWLLVALFLSCCGSGREGKLEYELEQVTIKNTHLKESYDGLVAAVKRDQDQIDMNVRAAGIAAGCDWILTLCPNELVESGRLAIESGYTPSLFYFWINVFIKIFLLAIFLAASVIATSLLYIKIIQPRQEEVDQAIAYIDGALEYVRLQSESLEAEIWEYENTLENLMQEESEKRALILQLDEIVGHLNKRQSLLEAEVGKLEELRDVLKVLD